MIVVLHKFFSISFQEYKDKMKQYQVLVDAVPSLGVLARGVYIQRFIGRYRSVSVDFEMVFYKEKGLW